VNDLAVYEKAPQEVTVTLDHFIESGFGKKSRLVMVSLRTKMML
jgi:hypothetical protein